MDPITLNLAAARAALGRGECPARELADFYLERIQRLNPELNAFLTVTAESARAQAARADAQRAGGDVAPALLGIPFALKDLFATQGVRTTAGSRILRAAVPMEDAHVVTRLHQAGSVMLGKLNMHEFAYGATNENPHYGDAKNPWALDRVTGGSSGGSAAAVAARMCLGALGSDTGGSIRIPAALCGVTGIKPTYGRVSLRGVIPLSWSNDHIGPLAQTAEDCALILDAIAGYDPRDPVSVNVPVPDFAAAINEPLRGLRLAAPRGYFESGVADEILRAVADAARVFQDLGAVRVERELDKAVEMFTANRTILRVEAAAYHRGWLESNAADYGEDVRARLASAKTISASEFALARRQQVELTRALELWFSDIDWMLIPTTRIPAPARGSDAVALAQQLTGLTAPFDVTGFPAISIPGGFTSDGLPIGIQLVAQKWNESCILRAAHQFQTVTDWHCRLPPL